MHTKPLKLSADAIDRISAYQANVIQSKTADFLLSNASTVGYIEVASKQIAKDISQIDIAELNETRKDDEYALDIRQVYCNKTGQPIAYRMEQDVQALLQLHGDAGAASLANLIDLTNGCAASWIRTDSETLEKLQKIDPYGYFMYACGLYCTRAAGNTKWNRTKQWLKPQYLREHRMNLILGYTALKEIPVRVVIEANEIWRKIHSLFAADEFAYEMTRSFSCDPKDYCTFDGIIKMQVSLERKLHSAMVLIQRKDMLLDNIAIADAVERIGGGKGMSQFRDQRKEDGDILADQIAKVFISVGMYSTRGSDKRVRLSKEFSPMNAPAPLEEKPINKLYEAPKGVKLQIKIGGPK